VLGFVLAEAFALCLCGGLVGLLLASLAGAMVEGTGGQFQLRLDGWVWLLGSRPSAHERRGRAAAGAAGAAPQDRRCAGGR